MTHAVDHRGIEKVNVLVTRGPCKEQNAAEARGCRMKSSVLECQLLCEFIYYVSYGGTTE